MCVNAHNVGQTFPFSDIDECSDGHETRCGDNTICVNEVANHTRGFTCVCQPGYEMDMILGICIGLCIGRVGSLEEGWRP